MTFFDELGSHIDDDFDPLHDPIDAGLAVGVAGALTDRRPPMRPDYDEQHVVLHEPKPATINAAPALDTGPSSLDDFIGQTFMMEQLKVHIASAKMRGVALDHLLLASGRPGVGKTTLAQLVAKAMGGEFFKLVPPFHRDTLFEAAQSLPNGGVLFIDEIHKMADGGKSKSEALLHMLEEGRLYTDDGVVDLNDITVIGATTDPGMLPSTILDRFVIKPHFEPYTVHELSLITAQFSGLYRACLEFDAMRVIAGACRGTPRVAREFVMAARDLWQAHRRPITGDEVLAFKQTDRDGISRRHKDYLLALYSFERVTANGDVVYKAGERTLLKVLRETDAGLAETESFLLDLGLIDQTPNGRALTDLGLERAVRYQSET